MKLKQVIAILAYLSRGEKPPEGEQETKKTKMATTLGAKKKRNDLTKREEKMANAPVRTANIPA